MHGFNLIVSHESYTKRDLGKSINIKMKEKVLKKNKAQELRMQPAYQKFYSALKNINRFRLDNPSFENISYLDNFFSEFRNITFVLYNCLPNGSKNKYYLAMSEKYLKLPWMQWFVDKRNEETHEHPTSYTRLFFIEIYGESSIVYSHKVMYDDEHHPQEDINTLLISLFSAFHGAIEVYFSVTHMIINNREQKPVDMFDMIRKGVNTMWKFLQELNTFFVEPNCDFQQLEKAIDSNVREILSSKILFTIDYVFSEKEKKIKAAERGMVTFRGEEERANLKSENFFSPSGEKIDMDSNLDLYKWFVMTHIPMYWMGARDLMSTFFIIFNDKSFVIKPFFSTLRTTSYRMINEVAGLVSKGDIRAVIYLYEAYLYDEKDFELYSELPYEDRKTHAVSEIVNIELLSKRTYRSISFDPDRLNDKRYTSTLMKNLSGEITEPFLSPIKLAFEELQKTENKEKD